MAGEAYNGFRDRKRFVSVHHEEARSIKYGRLVFTTAKRTALFSLARAAESLGFDCSESILQIFNKVKNSQAEDSEEIKKTLLDFRDKHGSFFKGCTHRILEDIFPEIASLLLDDPQEYNRIKKFGQNLNEKLLN